MILSTFEIPNWVISIGVFVLFVIALCVIGFLVSACVALLSFAEYTATKANKIETEEHRENVFRRVPEKRLQSPENRPAGDALDFR